MARHFISEWFIYFLSFWKSSIPTRILIMNILLTEIY
jgi:hypothetical protein